MISQKCWDEDGNEKECDAINHSINLQPPVQTKKPRRKWPEIIILSINFYPLLFGPESFYLVQLFFRYPHTKVVIYPSQEHHHL